MVEAFASFVLGGFLAYGTWVLGASVFRAVIGK